MTHTTSSSSLPPDKIFIGRVQEMVQFDHVLKRWIFDVALDSSERLDEVPSPYRRIPGLVVLLFGRGGIGKSTLLRRFRQMTLEQASYSVLPLHPIDWEFAIGDNRGFLNPLPGSRVDPLLYFDFLQKHLADNLSEKKEENFDNYKVAVYKVSEAREKVQQVFASLKQDENFSWFPKLISEEIVIELGTLFPPAEPSLQNDVVKDGTTRGLTFTASQLTQLRLKLRDKLDQKLTYYLDPATHLGLALGRDIAAFATEKPLLFFFDTYEEIDEGDLYLRILMGAAGSRVGWVIAGRGDIWSGLEQQKRYIEQVYGYKDLVLPQRSLALDFNSGSVGVFTLNEVMEYFARFQEEVPGLRSCPSITKDDAHALLEVTLGVPLAINIAAGLYQETKDLSVVVTNPDKKLKVVHAMVQRYLLHTRSDQDEKNKLYGLAMLRRSEESSIVSVALGIPAERVASDYEPEMKRLQRRYSFIFSDKEQPSLHQEVRYFMRIELFARRKESPHIQLVNTHLLEAYKQLLDQREEQSQYETLRQRFEDEVWTGTYLDLTEQLFWKEIPVGVCAALFFMFIGAVYQRTVNQEVTILGELFEPDMSRTYKEWWYLAKQSLQQEYSYSLSPQQKQHLIELERQISQRPPRFPVSLSKEYRQEAIACLWWRIGEAYVGEDDQQALKWYKKALTILPEESELRKATAEVAVDIAYQLKERQQYEESLTFLQQAIEWDIQSAWAFAVQGNVFYDLELYEQAIIACNRAIDLDPLLELAYTVRGSANAALKQYSQAIADHTHAINLHPQRIVRQRALSLSEQGRKTGSSIISSKEEIVSTPSGSLSRIEMLPERSHLSKNDLQFHKSPHSFLEAQQVNILAYRSRGATYAAMQDYERAIKDLSQAIALNSEDADAYYERALAYYNSNKYEKSIEDYTVALSLRENSLTYTKRGEAYSSFEHYEQALSDFDQALLLNPQHAWAYADRGLAHRLLEHYEQAIADFDQALLLNPQDSWTYANRGLAHRLLEHYEQAVSDFDQAISLNPDDTDTYLRRAYAHLFLRDREKALKDFRHITQIDPSDINASWMIIFVSFKDKMPEENIAHQLEAIAEIDPLSYEAATCRGVALGIRGFLREACAELEHALQIIADTQLDRESEDAAFWYGMLLAYRGRFIGAQEWINRALEAGLPPILLIPLYWLKHDRSEFFHSVAQPLLTYYKVWV